MTDYFKNLKKLTNNRFLNLYHMDAVNREGNNFDYFFASRNDIDKVKINTHSMEPEGIVIYPVLKDQPDIIVLIRQYRYPVGQWVYELPAGLVDQGETPDRAAIREMKEETGLFFEVYTGGESAFRRPSFLGPGMTDEMSATVYGLASGEVSQRDREASERIEVVLADKREVLRILQEEKVSLRAMLLLNSFLNSDENSPFSFLKIMQKNL